MPVALAGTAATLVASAVVAVYDNGWAVTGWDDVGRTASLVAAATAGATAEK